MQENFMIFANFPVSKMSCFTIPIQKLAKIFLSQRATMNFNRNLPTHWPLWWHFSHGLAVRRLYCLPNDRGLQYWREGDGTWNTKPIITLCLYMKIMKISYFTLLVWTVSLDMHLIRKHHDALCNNKITIFRFRFWGTTPPSFPTYM